ncbi:hypothetical protein Patl1_24712 [Pistacia atlantica]|uniref:Uncharacterized protein n=1 Tax=Pistacia atlantica TaxID=434234 RepID=A0ACC1AZ71_9ROSI|nr:hypothetical protein Patl1_24712 [Pistacia atlantica]
MGPSQNLTNLRVQSRCVGMGTPGRYLIRFISHPWCRHSLQLDWIVVGDIMWRGGGGCIDLFNAQPVGVALSVKQNPLHWGFPPLSTKRNAFSVSVSPTPLSNSINAVSTLKQATATLLPFFYLFITSCSPSSSSSSSIGSSLPPLRPLYGYWSNFLLGYYFNSYLDVYFFCCVQTFKKLGVSVDKLSKVVSEEVPGTLSSLKLSGLEINELTRQLTNLRQKISGTPFGKQKQKQ